MKWQIVLAALLLLLQSAVLFLPRMEVSGDRYLSVAMDVNKKAEEISAEQAEQAGAYTITNQYERGTSKREKKAKEYQEQIDQQLAGESHSLSGWQLAIWASTTRTGFEYPGIYFHEGKYLASEEVGETVVWMAVCVLGPSVFSMITLLLMLIRRRTPRLLLLLNGLLTLAAEWYFMTAMPEKIWNMLSGAVDSFELIGEGVLQISDIGVYAVTAAFWHFAGIGLYAHVAAGILLVLCSFAFFTIWKPEKELVEIEQIHRGGFEPEVVRRWEVFPMMPMPDEGYRGSGEPLPKSKDF